MCPKNMTATGRLGRFEYNDMDDTIMKALEVARNFV
jgi:UDP-galactopyranose mutase